MPFVLALEPDPKQAAIVRQIVRDRVGADFVLADSKDAALAALADRVPDLILVTALLSPRDEADLTDHLRDLEGAEHLQTLTIPLLLQLAVAAPNKKKKRGLLSALTGDSTETPVTAGCDPSVFATEIADYIARAAEQRTEAAAQRERASQKPRGKVRERSNAPATDAPPAAASSSSYWDWDSAPASVSTPPPLVAEMGETEQTVAPSDSSWANPWDAPAEPAPEPDAPAPIEEPPAPEVDPVASLLFRPAPPTAADMVAAVEIVEPSEEIDLSGLLDDDGPPAAVEIEPEIYTLPGDSFDVESPALDALRADLDRLRADRESVEVALTEARAAQRRAELAAEEAAARATEEVERRGREAEDRAREVEERAREEARVERLGRDDAERRAREEAERRVDAERMAREAAERRAQEEAERREAERVAREEAERLARDVQARMREEADAERRLREEAERVAREAEETRQREIEERRARDETERAAREEAERQAREEAELQIAAERRARAEAERLAREAEDERKREAEERRVREEAERQRAIEERRVREENERKARLEAEQTVAAERKAREEAEARAAAERAARHEAERRAREDAERLEQRAREEAERIERVAREEAARVAREAERAAKEAAAKAREEAKAERKAREDAERGMLAERKAREEAERRAKQEADRRTEAEARAAHEAERRAAESAARPAKAAVRNAGKNAGLKPRVHTEAVNGRNGKRGDASPPTATKPTNGKARPTLDEWGLYDPAKCGFGALYAKLEEIEESTEPTAADPDGGDAPEPTIEPSTPATGRNPRPLSMWAWRATGEPARPPARKPNGLAPDDFRELLARLNIPAAIAAVRYASGARIRRVRVSPAARQAKRDDSQVIILSRKLLNAVREQPPVRGSLTPRG